MIRLKYPRQWLVLLLGFFWWINLPLSVNSAELRFQVAPQFSDSQVAGADSFFDINAAPKTQEDLALVITNPSDTSVIIDISVHTAFTNVNGVVEYAMDAEIADPTLTYFMEDLVRSPEAITLAAGEQRTVVLPLTMPSEAFDGYLAGGIRIQEIMEDESTNDNALTIRNEFAYVLGILLSNERESMIEPDLDLLKVFADQLNYRNVFSATLQNYTPVYINQLAVTAEIRAEGQTDVLYENHVEGMQMAPNSHFDFPIPLEGDRFRSGDYVLTLHAQSKEYEWSFDKSFTIETDEARQFNRTDVNINEQINWWAVLAIASLAVTLILTVSILWKRKERDDEKKN
ncbi:DUF916 and DUF3324 domain-containing protein [Enterococcus sp. DIV0876]|uniref:DUF916 and DUF3324 domain-containing protein n=1 Tax=Enterococcus sp. DIV0876 TaxID=2774633 RepID=UPI003D2FD35B